MDTLQIKQLLVPAIIGVWHSEREITQDLLIDIETHLDSKPAGQSDNLSDTLDYSELAKEVTHYVSQSKFSLLEALANQLADFIMTRFSLSWLHISITKKPHDMPNVAGVCMTIERSK